MNRLIEIESINRSEIPIKIDPFLDRVKFWGSINRLKFYKLTALVCILIFSNTRHSHRMCTDTDISFSTPHLLHEGVFALHERVLVLHERVFALHMEVFTPHEGVCSAWKSPCSTWESLLCMWESLLTIWKSLLRMWESLLRMRKSLFCMRGPCSCVFQWPLWSVTSWFSAHRRAAVRFLAPPIPQ